ncbi:hypothetical protein ASG82_12620 [Mycobacterium sp. Soil538]|nr:hypothetical protein ASG82_12620 [Mycobacterium sp. Soil538]
MLLADAEMKIVAMYWDGLNDEVKKTVATHYFVTQRELERNRSRSAAWQAAPDWVLLDTVSRGRDLDAHAELAAAMLQSKYGLLTETNRIEMEGTRVKIATKGLETAESLKQSIEQWTTLAKAAPWFMGAALLISVAILIGAFLLVKWDHLNGYQFSLAIFVCAVFVVSPATLLLLGRPLRGIDNASLTGKSPDDTNGKSGNDAASHETAK